MKDDLRHRVLVHYLDYFSLRPQHLYLLATKVIYGKFELFFDLLFLKQIVKKFLKKLEI